MDVSIDRIKVVNTGNTLAYVDLKFEGQIIIKGCKIMNGSKGKFLAFPSQKGKDDKWYPIVMVKDLGAFQAIQSDVFRLAQEHGV